MEKNNTFKEYIAPVVVLVAICLVITLALALTNNTTAPVIEKNTKAAADQTRTELIADADFYEVINQANPNLDLKLLMDKAPELNYEIIDQRVIDYVNSYLEAE